MKSNKKQNINNKKNMEPEKLQAASNSSKALPMEDHVKTKDNDYSNKHKHEVINESLSKHEIKKVNELQAKLEELQIQLGSKNDLITKLTNSLNNVNGELTKTKNLLDDERKQLIQKLAEKTKLAQQQLEQKFTSLELNKQKELESAKHNISTEIVTKFIDPIMLFESTIERVPNNPAAAAYLQGYRMISQMFKESLDNLGIEQINVAIGDEFNENFMSAFDVELHPEFAPNKVVRVVKKGFVLNNKIIKYVSVIVSK